ncbi:Protein phosphatase 2C 1, partial [Podila humilis]
MAHRTTGHPTGAHPHESAEGSSVATSHAHVHTHGHGHNPHAHTHTPQANPRSSHSHSHHSHSHPHPTDHHHHHTNSSNSNSHPHRQSDAASAGAGAGVALDTSLATAISSSTIEKCDSPDDTSSIEGSTQSAVGTPAAEQPGEDLQCALKDIEEYEFAVGVAEDRNKRCRRTMEDTHAFIYNYEGITGHGFFAIFDGHAGKSAADWCGQHFHEVLNAILEERGNEDDVDIQELVNNAFLTVDEQLAVALQQGRASGCTAIMAYMRKEGDA